MLDEQTKSSGVYSEAELTARLDEGLKIQMIHELSGRTVGFIEYTPGEFAAENNITTKVITFQTAGELLKNSPNPYGVFGLVLDGKLLACSYLLTPGILTSLPCHKKYTWPPNRSLFLAL